EDPAICSANSEVTPPASRCYLSSEENLSLTVSVASLSMSNIARGLTMRPAPSTDLAIAALAHARELLIRLQAMTPIRAVNVRTFAVAVLGVYLERTSRDARGHHARLEAVSSRFY